MVPFNLKVLAKFGLCSNCWQKLDECSLDHARKIFTTALMLGFSLKFPRWYIKIQPQQEPQTIDLSTRLWGINIEFVGFIPHSLVLRSIVWDWILIVYRNCMVYLHLGKQYWCWKQCFPLAKLGDIEGNAYAMKTMNVSGKMVPRFVDVLSTFYRTDRPEFSPMQVVG